VSASEAEMDFSGRVVVVTGAARGIGRTYADGFLRRGARVVAIDILGDRLGSLQQQWGDSVRIIDCDVSDEQAVAKAFGQVAAWTGDVHHLVNNAALMLDVEVPFKPFWEISIQEWDRYLAVNARGPFLCCKHAYRLMDGRAGASIVNVTSDAVWHGYAGQLAYFASKGAAGTMTKCLARELGPLGIRVNAVAPGLTQSEAVRQSEFLQERRGPIREERALQRDQEPEDVLGAVLFLCDAASGAITGQTLVVNSGGIMP
jgi:NAD(P)-dependent dehydrogenase (short-subunit alcohol dehydrogenase family)